jgi:hypothetical protein
MRLSRHLRVSEQWRIQGLGLNLWLDLSSDLIGVLSGFRLLP